jgi:hypothetical protein
VGLLRATRSSIGVCSALKKYSRYLNVIVYHRRLQRRILFYSSVDIRTTFDKQIRDIGPSFGRG